MRLLGLRAVLIPLLRHLLPGRPLGLRAGPAQEAAAPVLLAGGGCGRPLRPVPRLHRGGDRDRERPGRFHPRHGRGGHRRRPEAELPRRPGHPRRRAEVRCRLPQEVRRGQHGRHHLHQAYRARSRGGQRLLRGGGPAPPGPVPCRPSPPRGGGGEDPVDHQLE